MTNNNNRMIVFASILGAILATSILALNPSTITNAQAMPYGSGDYDDRYSYGDQYGDDSNYYQDGNRYSYDKKDQKSSHTDIQKINCVNSIINVNGIDFTQIPEDTTTTAAGANEASVEGTADAANTQNGNSLADRINFDRNLVNICVNNNDNEQTRVTPTPTDGNEEPQSCEDCFHKFLTQEQIDAYVEEVGESTSTISTLCLGFIANPVNENDFLIDIVNVGVETGVAADLVECLKSIGVIFV